MRSDPTFRQAKLELRVGTLKEVSRALGYSLAPLEAIKTLTHVTKYTLPGFWNCPGSRQVTSAFIQFEEGQDCLCTCIKMTQSFHVTVTTVMDLSAASNVNECPWQRYPGPRSLDAAPDRPQGDDRNPSTHLRMEALAHTREGIKYTLCPPQNLHLSEPHIADRGQTFCWLGVRRNVQFPSPLAK
ncbi:hypothetical protein RRG08_034380 [Elysia crispata]|uniref:Uncharacterized protein n=1 Tax=Elysia crispata TaxID=231223 RepID=A0AAE0YCY0_9GAST|nr:hypothetical protein RRG08_034380 [Elysia crispata]